MITDVGLGVGGSQAKAQEQQHVHLINPDFMKRQRSASNPTKIHRCNNCNIPSPKPETYFPIRFLVQLKKKRNMDCRGGIIKNTMLLVTLNSFTK